MGDTRRLDEGWKCIGAKRRTVQAVMTKLLPRDQTEMCILNKPHLENHGECYELFPHQRFLKASTASGSIFDHFHKMFMSPSSFRESSFIHTFIHCMHTYIGNTLQ